MPSPRRSKGQGTGRSSSRARPSSYKRTEPQNTLSASSALSADALGRGGVSPKNEQSPEQVALVYLRALPNLTHAQSAGVYLRDEQSRKMERLIVCGDPAAGLLEKWDRAVMNLARKKKPSRVSRGRLIAIPLKHRRSVEGVLVIQGLPRSEREDSSVNDLLDGIASRLMIALDHSRLAQKYAQKVARI